MADTAADVPGKFDVIINGHGYMFVEQQTATVPYYNDQRATYGYTPTFLERTNVGDGYGDNAQDFFLTASQNDWSLGENQKFFRTGDADRKRRYWAGTNVDVMSVPGQVSLQIATSSESPSNFTGGAVARTPTIVYVSGGTRLTYWNGSASSDAGLHGLGATPSRFGLTTDGLNCYLTTTAAGTVGVRRWSGSAFTTFSATASDSLAFLGNTLYGYSEAGALLRSYAADGTPTTIYTWKGGEGTALTGSTHQTKLLPFGGSLLILRSGGVRNPVELWQYDGTATSQLAEFPAGFVMGSMEVVNGVVFVSGYVASSLSTYLQKIYYYTNGSVGLLWTAPATTATTPTAPAMTSWREGLAFSNDTDGKLMLYNMATGGVQCLFTYTAANTNAAHLSANSAVLILTWAGATSAYVWPNTPSATSGTLISSLYDFDNSLTKQFRGIKIDFDSTGGTADIAYQIDSVDGSWTNLQTGATSGTEYTMTGVSGRSIAVKITLNKVTVGPILKRLYIRASPILQQYRKCEYLIDCTGHNGQNIKLRNNQVSALDGQSLANNLVTALQSTSPFTIVDRFGSYTGIIEPDQTEFIEIAPEEFVVKIGTRQV